MERVAVNPVRSVRLVVLGLILVIALVMVQLARVAQAVPPPHARGNIEVVVRSGFAYLIDEAPAATHEFDLSAGDLLLFHDPVFDSEGEKEIGSAVTRVQVMQGPDDDGLGDVLFLLDCTIRLNDGNLLFSGAGQLGDLGTGAEFALVGGTAQYSGARGTVEMVMGDEATKLNFTFARP
jgi:hypothetical protein